MSVVAGKGQIVEQQDETEQEHIQDLFTNVSFRPG